MRVSRRAFLLSTAATAAAALPWQAQAAPPRLRQDWHSHTHRHGGKDNAILKDMVEKNARYGMKLYGISDHIDRRDERESFAAMIAANREELAATEVPTGMRVMIGTEASMISPTLCCLEEDIAQELDYVMVSCNHYHLKHVENPAQATAEAYAHHYLDMLQGAIDLGFVDTIGHPFYHQKLQKKLGDETLHAILKAYPEDRLTQVLKNAAAVHMAFEINPHHANLALDWFRELVQEVRIHGGKFTLGTDAHDLESLCYPPRNDRAPETIVAELGITDDDLKWTAKLGPKANKV